MKYLISKFHILSIIFAGFYFNTNSVKAQSIKIDGTTQTQLESCPGDCVIKGGLQQGNNLFHSFERFNIDVGETVLFQDSGLTNIIGRVTGNEISEILGTLGITGGDANLFLLNPNGIIFGENSSLDVNGSFLATTADAIRFGEQGLLNATSDAIPLLTINPSALFFAQGNQGTIINQSIEPSTRTDSPIPTVLGLRVPDGESILLVGNNIIFDGGRANALGGRVELGGLAEAGEIKVNFPENNNQNISLGFSDRLQKANVSLINDSRIVVVSEDGGDIVVNANNLIIENNSRVFAGIAPNLGTDNSQAGNITLNVTQDLTIKNSVVENSIFNEAKGNGGNININAGYLSINNSWVQAITSGRGNAGDIQISVPEGLVKIKQSFVTTSVNSTNENGSEFIAIGNSGDIKINSKTLVLEEGSEIGASTLGQGNAGNIEIFVKEDINVSSNSFIFSSIGSLDINALGNGGEINIEARNISLDSGSQLVANVFGQGEGGDISLNISDSVTITGFGTDGFSSGIVTATEAGGQGQAGDIEVNTNNFNITDGAIVSSQTLNKTDGGDIFITANTFEALNGGQVVASADSSGDAGNITINADNIFLSGTDSDFANRLAQFPNNIGNEAPGNSGFFASSRQDASDLGGDIIIEAGKLNIQKGAEIAVDSQGTGEGGKIELQANELTLNNGSITAETSINQGGNITLNVDNTLTFENSGEITATAGTAGGRGDGGNVTINSDFILAYPTNNNYQITANAFQGNGGNIQITTNSFLGREFVNLDASSNAGIDGNVSVEVLEVDPARGLTELPDVPVDVAALLAQNICEVDNGEDGETSSFINIGRGGLPPNPYEPLDSNDDIFVDVQLPTEWREKNTENSSVSSQVTEPIVEASAWIINEKGNVELVSKMASKNLGCQ